MQDNNFIKRKAISGVLWKFSERIIAQLVSLTVSIILARILLPEDFSVVSLVTIFFSFSNILISGGLNTALIQKKDADIVDYSSVFYATMFIAIIVYTALFLGAPTIANIYNNDLLVSIIRIMGISVFINAYKSIVSAYISSNLEFRKFFLSTLIGTVVSAIVGITMALNGFGAWALVIQQLLIGLFDAIFLSFSTKFFPKLVFSIKKLKSLFNYSWKVFVSSIISEIYEQINPLIIGIKYSSADLAFYTKGKSFPIIVNASISDTVSAVVFPILSKYQENLDYVLQLTRRFMRLSSYLVFPLMIGFFAISDNFILLLLTDKWAEAIPFVQIFCISYMFNIIQTGNLQVIRAIGRSDILLILEIIKKVIYFIIIALFIVFSTTPTKLAFSSVLCTLFATLINTYPNRKLIGYKYKYQIIDLFPNFMISVIMGAMVYSLKSLQLTPLLVMIVQIVVGIISYVILSVITKNESFKYLLNFIKINFLGGE